MRRHHGILALAVLSVAVGGAVIRAAGLPLWAYGYTTPPPADADYTSKCTAARPFDCARGSAASGDVPRNLPGTDKTFTVTQVQNDYGPADWYPGDHPPMPDVVAHGKQAIGLRACGLCHFPNGQGKPENAPVAGLPVNYFLQQLADFRSGARRSADRNKANAFEMAAIASALTDAEMKTIAQYYGSIKYRPWVKVTETASVPKFNQTANGLFQQADGSATEPIGQRLIEVPEDRDGTAILRNPRSGFIAYVPVNTLKRGEDLVNTGGATAVDGKVVLGRTTQCTVCHGPDLRGLADIPPIAGRPASYLARQLYDIQQGARRGPQASLMKPVVASLTEGDILAIAAYVSSRMP
jgi:cytochrome c553